jgi:GMP synthase-like glutamine amidotransferase
MRIGLILCGELPERYASIAGDFPEWFESLLGDVVTPLDTFDATGCDLPDDPSTCDAYIISGSASSVYDDEPWISGLEEFIRGVVEADVPIFGICFGHQVLAKAMGGTVERAENGWGIGVHTMHVHEDRTWMNTGAESVKLLMSHQDQIVELPDNAIVLGSSDHCENYLVEFTPTAVGIQGHPEFPLAFAEVLYEDKREVVGDLADDAIASLEIPTDADTVAAWIRNVLSGSGRVSRRS